MPKSAAQQFADLQRLPAEQAVAYLQARGQLTKTFSWQDLWHDEHAQQFTVSRLARLDILKALQDGITQSVQGDLSRRDWTRDARALLAKEGWWGEREVLDEFTGEMVKTKFDPARLKLIFDTNTRMAYSAGLWERIERNKDTHPYIRYITRGDERVRLQHQRWANLTLPVDHPFWKTRFPPNGFRCRCRAMSISQAEYDRRRAAGSIVTEAPPDDPQTFENRRTGEISQVPAGVQPGFDYNPGIARATRLRQIAAEKFDALPAPLRRAAELEMTAEAGLVDNAGMKIESFAREALSVADRKIELSLGVVTITERILQDTGFDVTGFERVIDNYGIRHTIKRHGNQATEEARGQVAVTLADFDLIPLITSSPDRVFADGKNKIGRDVIVFTKIIDGIGYRHVEEIRPKGKLVATDSLRKKKGAWGS